MHLLWSIRFSVAETLLLQKNKMQKNMM